MHDAGYGYFFTKSEMRVVVVKTCDPTNALTAQSALTEGILDLMSCVTFFVMADNNA